MTTFDQHANFSYSTIATAPSPANSGTSLIVQTGTGVLFPAPPFEATIWPALSVPLSTNAEIVRVTAIVGDTFTITRTQESSTARSIIVGDQIAATITTKVITDIETAVWSIASGGTGVTTVPTAGALLIGTSAGGYAVNNLTAGTNIAITNSSGSIIIDNTLGTGGVVFDPDSIQDIGATISVGSSGSPPHADHIHKGVHGIYIAPNADVFGDVALVGSANISIAQSSGSFIFASSGSFLPQVHDINGQYHNGFPLTPDHGGTGVNNGTNQLTIPATGTAVLTTRAINTTAPLSGGGDLSADRTLTISQASHTTDGYLSAVDWTTFNNKQGNLAPFQTDSPASVGSSAITGTSGSVPHSDHAHQGIHGIFTAPNAVLTGDIALVGGTNITITQSSGSFTLTSSGSFLPQVHDINGQYHNGTPLRPENGGTGVNNGTFQLTIPATGTAVLTTRTINTTAPITGGGNLSADRTIAIPQASHTVDGYLSSTDWTTFNSKVSNAAPLSEAAGSNVAAAGAIGSSGSVAYSDHAHQGVHGIYVAPSADQYGDIALVGSAGISITQSSGSFTFSTSGSFPAVLANPTSSVGLSAVNGSATTAMRSDAAPALDQSISPTWTGIHTHNPSTSPSEAVIFEIAPLISNGGRDSHSLRMSGQSYDTTPHQIDWKQYANVQGTDGTSFYIIASRIDSDDYTPRLWIGDTGTILIPSAQIVFQSGANGTLSWSVSAGNKSISLPNASGTVSLGVGVANTIAYWSGVNTLASKSNGAGFLHNDGAGSLAWQTVPVSLTPFQTNSPANVGSAAVIGTSGSVPHSDHVHQGVHGLFVAPSSSQYGDIALAGSGDISVTQSSGSFTFGGSSGSYLPQVHDINGQYHNGFPLRVAGGGLGTIQAPTSGALPIGTAGGIYVPNNLIAGTGIAITNSSGSITIGFNSSGSTFGLSEILFGDSNTGVVSSNASFTYDKNAGTITTTKTYAGTIGLTLINVSSNALAQNRLYMVADSASLTLNTQSSNAAGGAGVIMSTASGFTRFSNLSAQPMYWNTNGTERGQLSSSGSLQFYSTITAKPTASAGIGLFPGTNGGTNFTVQLSPSNLSANRTFTFADTSGSVIVGSGVSSYIPYYTGSVTLSGDAGLVYDSSTSSPTVSSSVSQSPAFIIRNDTNDTEAAYLYLNKNHLASPVSGDYLGHIAAQGLLSSSYWSGVTIDFQVDGSPSTRVPGKVIFGTGTATAIPSTALTIRSNKNVEIASGVLLMAETTAVDTTALIEASSNSTTMGTSMFVHSSSGSTDAPYYTLARSRGSLASPTKVVDEDRLGSLLFQAYDGSAYQTSALIRGEMDINPTSGSMPGRLVFYTTPGGSVTPLERMRITSAGNVLIGQTNDDGSLLVVNANAAQLPTPSSSTVAHFGGAAGAAFRLLLDTFGANGAVTFRRSNGTATSPSALVSDDSIASLTAFGYGATSYTTTSRAYINMFASQNWTDSNQGTYIQFAIVPNNSTTLNTILQLGSSNAALTMGFFGTAPAVKQASGANLTNNVTAGGTTDQIDNYTSLTTYSTDASAIRNDIYQLARKLKQVNDALRTYGLLT